MNKINFKRAFTLIELLVVIAIIGILSTIGVVSFNSARKKARDAKRIADLKMVHKLIMMYYTEYEEFPLTANGGCGKEVCITGKGWEYLENDLKSAGILSGSLPKDPKSGYKYYYCNDANSAGSGYAKSQEFVLAAKLETNNPVLDNDFDGTFFTHWGCDDLGCGDGGKMYCIVRCLNQAWEGPGNNSKYPPNCGTY